MKLHPRALPVQLAEAEIGMALNRMQEQHDLTDLEMVRALLHYLATHTKYMLRVERHPDDPERKADEE